MPIKLLANCISGAFVEKCRNVYTGTQDSSTFDLYDVVLERPDWQIGIELYRVSDIQKLEQDCDHS
jgi:hypothetical protein